MFYPLWFIFYFSGDTLNRETKEPVEEKKEPVVSTPEKEPLKTPEKEKIITDDKEKEL